MKLRGALYGCGMISEFHLRGWLRIPEVEMVALGNRTLSRAIERRDAFVPGARVYSGLAEMLDAEQPDFVDILTAPALHLEHCRVARERGIHIICQKPLADTLETAREIAGMMEGYGKVFAIHENHRYRPWFARLARQAREGAFGKIHFAKFEHLNGSGPPPGFKTESEAGVLLEYGSHLVDMMRALLGEPRRVYARFARVNPSVSGESLAHLTYEYPEATAVVAAAWKNSGITQGEVSIHGERREAVYEGTLTRGEEGRLRVSEGGRVIEDEARSPYDDYVESFYLLEREATGAMLGRGRVTQTAGEHLRTVIATFAAYESARRGEPVDIGA